MDAAREGESAEGRRGQRRRQAHVTTRYRLTSGKAIRAGTRSGRAARALHPARIRTSSAATCARALAGTTVLIQRQQGAGWATVARATVDGRATSSRSFSSRAASIAHVWAPAAVSWSVPARCSGLDPVKTALAAALALVLAPAAAAMPLRAGFSPTDPLAPKQYYLAQDHAFDAFPAELPVSTRCAWRSSTRASTAVTRSSAPGSGGPELGRRKRAHR